MEAEAVLEPKVRRDGRCLVCRGPRKVPSPLQRGVLKETYERDPFCSAVCARKFFGTALVTDTKTSS